MDLFESFLEQFRKRRRNYIYNRSTQKKDKKNGLNMKQTKFRPDHISYRKITGGANKTRAMFDSANYINESDC